MPIWIACLALSVWGTTKLTVSSDNRVFYSEANPNYLALQRLEDKYLPNHNISFLLRPKNPEREYLTKLIRSVEWLTQRAWEIENVIRVDSIENYPIAIASADDSFSISSLSEIACGPDLICNSESQLQNPPQGIDRRLISGDGKSLAVSLSLELDETDTSQIQRITKDVEGLRAEFTENFPEITLHHTGGIPMMEAFSRAADQDSSKLAPITILLIFVLTGILIGSAKGALILLVAGVSSALLTLGGAGFAGHVINPATSVASIMILTLVVTSAMHYVSSYLNDSRIYDSYTATVNATRVNLRPIALTTVTSVAGFLSLAFADAPPIGQLGILASVGVSLGALHIFLLGPIFLKYLTPREKPNLAQRISIKLSKTRLSRAQITILATLLTLAAAGIFTLKINDDFIKYFDPTFQFRTETDYVSTHLSGPNHLEIDLTSPDHSPIFNRFYLRETAQLATFLREQEGVANVFSIVDIFEQIEPLFETSQFEATDEQLSQFYLAFELSLQEGQSATDYISRDQTSSRVSIILGESDSTSIRQLIENTETWSAINLTLKAKVTGENAPVAYLTPNNFKSMSLGIAGTLLIAAILVAGTLGSFRLAALCLACTAAPILIGFGLWGWLFDQIGLASVVVLAITIGIVIDDAIHIISRYQDILRTGAEYSTAIEQTTRIVGGAIVASSLALAGGFFVLAQSGFGVNSAMGLCTTLIVLSALLVDLVLLPWVLREYAS